MCGVGNNLCWNVCWSHLAQCPQSCNGWKRFPVDRCDRWRPLQVRPLLQAYEDRTSNTMQGVQSQHPWSKTEILIMVNSVGKMVVLSVLQFTWVTGCMDTFTSKTMTDSWHLKRSLQEIQWTLCPFSSAAVCEEKILKAFSVTVIVVLKWYSTNTNE